MDHSAVFEAAFSEEVILAGVPFRDGLPVPCFMEAVKYR